MNVEFNSTFCYCRIVQNAIWWPRFGMEYKNALNDFIWKRSVITSSVSRGNRSAKIHLSRIPTNNDTESRSWWTKIQSMYEHVHPNLALVLLFVCTKLKCGKGPTTLRFMTYDSLQCSWISISALNYLRQNCRRIANFELFNAKWVLILNHCINFKTLLVFICLQQI